MFGMQIEPEDLFTDEHVLVSKNANAIITLNDYALKEIPIGANKALELIGFASKEEIGGELHVTNYRLIFKSHPLNRARGKFSIFLDTILDIKDVASFSKTIQIDTLSQSYEFVVWGIPEFLEKINAARKAASTTQMPELKKKIENDYTKVGNGFEMFNGLDVFARPLDNTEEIAKTPFGFSNLLNVVELLGKINVPKT